MLVLGVVFKIVDFGGGFGVFYVYFDKMLDFVLVVDGVFVLLMDIDQDLEFVGLNLMVEFGCYFSVLVGFYVVWVMSVKEFYGEVFVIIDGGMYYYFVVLGNFGQVLKKDYLVVLVNCLNEVGD